MWQNNVFYLDLGTEVSCYTLHLSLMYLEVFVGGGSGGGVFLSNRS